MSRETLNKKPSKAAKTRRRLQDGDRDKFGDKFFHRGDFEGARHAYEIAVSLDPNDIGAWNGLGNSQFSQNNFSEALKSFENVKLLDPDNPSAWYNIGVTKLGLEDYAGAITALEHTISLHPGDGDAWFNLGFARYKQHNLQGAIMACERSLELSPDDADILYTLACYFALDGQVVDAMRSLSDALLLNPSLAPNAREEPDFNRIRDLREFQKIVTLPGIDIGNWLVEPEKVEERPASPIHDEIQQPLNNKDKTLVGILRQYEYIGGKVRVKVKFVNAGEEGLLRLVFTLDVPKSFRLLRVEPEDYNREGPVLRLNDLLPNEEKSIAYVLEPLICGKESLGGTVSGMNHKGRPFALPMNPLEVLVRCPLFTRPEEANLPTLQKMLGDLPVKSERVFYLPDALAPEDALEITKGAISERDVRLVGAFTGTSDEGTFEESAWFYGVTKVGQKRYVLTTSVSEKDRTIRLSTACDDEAGCTGFLAETGASIRRELVRRGAVDSEEGVIELTCEKCGATLPHAPVIGRDVVCPECRWTWKVGDFFR